MREKLKLAGNYLLARLQEPSTWRGLVIIVSALGWARLDGSNTGEAVMQGGLLIAGLIQAVLPQQTLYGRRDG